VDCFLRVHWATFVTWNILSPQDTVSISGSYLVWHMKLLNVGEITFHFAFELDFPHNSSSMLDFFPLTF
jgi:hypothetical protein